MTARLLPKCAFVRQKLKKSRCLFLVDFYASCGNDHDLAALAKACVSGASHGSRVIHSARRATHLQTQGGGARLAR